MYVILENLLIYSPSILPTTEWTQHIPTFLPLSLPICPICLLKSTSTSRPVSNITSLRRLRGFSSLWVLKQVLLPLLQHVSLCLWRSYLDPCFSSFALSLYILCNQQVSFSASLTVPTRPHTADNWHKHFPNEPNTWITQGCSFALTIYSSRNSSVGVMTFAG